MATQQNKQFGEVYAAIALALYEATELHDEESYVLTFKRPVQVYSPWNFKLPTFRRTPIRK
ncbi:MAG: hypothetical protein LBN18_03675 [Dysgonamonadaceae bacterium]|jgi:hypothetical protein|nr:hypothetical protein [Dysgonamonadaceae bacterium]